MTTYWKAVRPNGRDFYSNSVQWAPEKEMAPKGRIVKHPRGAPGYQGGAAAYLSVSTTPTDCTGHRWPCRLLEVEPVGESWPPHPQALPNKRAALVFRVIREAPALDVFGPQAEHVAAFLERVGNLTAAEASSLAAAWAAARAAARDAARAAARAAVWDAAWAAARAAARASAWASGGAAVEDAAMALLVRDLIPTEHYDTLTRPWRTTIGPLHPDDPEMAS